MVVEGKEWGPALLWLFLFDRGLYREQIQGRGQSTTQGMQSDQAATVRRAVSSSITQRAVGSQLILWDCETSTAILHTKGKRNDPLIATNWTLTEAGHKASPPHAQTGALRKAHRSGQCYTRWFPLPSCPCWE